MASSATEQGPSVIIPNGDLFPRPDHASLHTELQIQNRLNELSRQDALCSNSRRLVVDQRKREDVERALSRAKEDDEYAAFSTQLDEEEDELRKRLKRLRRGESIDDIPSGTTPLSPNIPFHRQSSSPANGEPLRFAASYYPANVSTRLPPLRSTSGLSREHHAASDAPPAKDTRLPLEPQSHHTHLQENNQTTTLTSASTHGSPMAGPSTEGLDPSTKDSAPVLQRPTSALGTTLSHVQPNAESTKQSATGPGKRIVRPTKKARTCEGALRTPKQRAHSPTQPKQTKSESGKRKPRQYTEAWKKRHTRCLREDDQGQGIWLHPIQDIEMYIRCNYCGRMNFETVHGFLCHMVKIHGESKGFVTGLEAVLDRYGVEVGLEDGGFDPPDRRERQSSQEQRLGNAKQGAIALQQGKDERRVRILTTSTSSEDGRRIRALTETASSEDEKPRKTIGTIEDDYSSSSVSSLPSDDEEEVEQEDSIKVASSATITQGSNGTLPDSAVPRSTFTWSPNPISNPRPPPSKPPQSGLQKVAAARAPPSTIPPTPSSQPSSNSATQAALSKAREINTRLSDADSDFSPSLDSTNPVPSNPAKPSHAVVLKYGPPIPKVQASTTATASQDSFSAPPAETDAASPKAPPSKVTTTTNPIKYTRAKLLPPPPSSAIKRKSLNNAADTTTSAAKATTTSANAKRRKTTDLTDAYDGVTEELGVRKNGGRIVRRVKAPTATTPNGNHPADGLQNIGPEDGNGMGKGKEIDGNGSGQRDPMVDDPLISH